MPLALSRGTTRMLALLASLTLAAAMGVAVVPPATAETTQAIVATTASPEYREVGTWATARDASYDGVRPRYSRSAGDTATWKLTAPAAGAYRLGTYFTGSVDNSEDVAYSWSVANGAASEPVLIDQTAGGNTWHALGSVDLDAGDTVSLTVTAGGGTAATNSSLGAITRADAVRLSPAGAACETVDTVATSVAASSVDYPQYRLQQEGTSVRIETAEWAMNIERVGFRYGFETGGEMAADAHPETGLQLGSDAYELCSAIAAEVTGTSDDSVELNVVFSNGREAHVHLGISDDDLNMRVAASDGTDSVIRAQVAGEIGPAYGLGDLGGWGSSLNVYGTKDLDYYAQQNPGTTEQRFVSNFAVFPERRLAEVAFDDGHLAVQIDDDATLLGVEGSSMGGLHYFFGDMETIYRAYKSARNEAGYLDARPEETFFGVGYESYGALGYNTNQSTITQSVSDYLDEGFPVRWAVTGSGFWPYIDGAQGTTSSFGMWGEKYPDPAAYKTFFDENDIALILGLRQTFPALPEDGGTYDPQKDGPYVQEALDAGYFIADGNGDARAFSTISFPSGRVYMIDPDNADAVQWFVEKERLWEADGFKEDHMYDASANEGFALNDLVNAVDLGLHEDGALMMVRNSAYSVPGSILRINDTDYNHGGGDRDRAVINSLAFAASGQPNYYPDIVGGRIISDLATNTDKQKYLTRNAMFAAMSPSMSFGNEPWVMKDADLVAATVKAAQWHDEYLPYIYAAAISSYETGYPSTATPLPIAYPDDAATYELVSRSAKQYEWMLGPSLLVAPLYGSDATTVTARDVYLPEGTWTDIETGDTFVGPTTLDDYPQPFGKIPAFVGGDGILVHQIDERREARVFAMAGAGARLQTVAEDGTTGSIRVAEALGTDPRAVEVRDSDGNTVEFSVDDVTGALEFVIVDGEDYVLQKVSAEDTADASPDGDDRADADSAGAGSGGTDAGDGTSEYAASVAANDSAPLAMTGAHPALTLAVGGGVLALAGILLALLVRRKRRSVDA
ncbi:hypothetical protein FHX48_001869 [Microbacterium halimionae]|uniref:Gram-positive cocci surface proteins LPxTG domain-containing protein n=1 Tax=Microbacterium halimionae TaxID=1526413 RepID=A0A7W3PM72_9MICO|nr:TIM-barrel domain-containing protein [Microbacterium halimionae]MBA8816776.1 hypothetical protein [Microbacterium halimionae]NII94928.1 hypothetical protein [Microbacterium halimionae]